MLHVVAEILGFSPVKKIFIDGFEYKVFCTYICRKNRTLAKKKSTPKQKKQTPLMTQYFSVKAKHPDAILLFRVGDFYETFSDDAVKTANTLGIVLTKRNNGGSDIELAGFPYHSLDLYLPRLIKAGFRVAICEQLEKPSKEKKIVKRGVTEIVTPGLTTDNKLLNYKENNFLCSLHYGLNGVIGIAFLDISTGEFMVSQGDLQKIHKLVQGFNPSEIIFAKANKNNFQKQFGSDYYSYQLDEWVYTEDYTQEMLYNHFQVNSLKGFGIEQLEYGSIAAGAILHYLQSTENNQIQHINSIQRIMLEDYMWLDRFTIRNLELVHSTHPTGIPLIQILDNTVTPMGSRLIRKWLLLPLIQINDIHRRLQKVAFFHREVECSEELIDHLKTIGDLERLISKVPSRKINPREILQLKLAMFTLDPIKSILADTGLEPLANMGDALQPCEQLRDRIEREIHDDAPGNINKGNIIKSGWHSELDELRNLISNTKQILLELQQREAEKTGITNLKIGFNNVFGYYLEVTNKYKNQGLIPEHWVRKQTLTGSERYITEELKTLETKILGAEEKLTKLELQLYDDLVISLQDYIQSIQNNASLLASLDCLIGLAYTARKYDYCEPVIDESYAIDIKAGRHPVIEQHLDLGESYIPNDVFLDNEQQQILMITGPNMSGKSAVLRQTALITLMAQMGSFVPAQSARIGIVDKLFTRVGASDNISSGESTFMVEMNETASIMNNISARSLVLLDEIGRGTSTYDGISIAWSLAEYLHEHKNIRPKTLFATHYHELNELANQFDRIKNYCIATKEHGQKVIFLRKLIPGGSKHSFGIHVAKLAGMPKTILQRASDILSKIEKKSISGEDIAAPTPSNFTHQLSIFETTDETAGQLKSMLMGIDINTMSPIECMMKLNEMKQVLEDE